MLPSPTLSQRNYHAMLPSPTLSQRNYHATLPSPTLSQRKHSAMQISWGTDIDMTSWYNQALSTDHATYPLIVLYTRVAMLSGLSHIQVLIAFSTHIASFPDSLTLECEWVGECGIFPTWAWHNWKSVGIFRIERLCYALFNEVHVLFSVRRIFPSLARHMW